MTDKDKMLNSEKNSSQAAATSENALDFYDLWNMLVRWKAMVIGVAFVTFSVIVANALFNAPSPLYKSTAYLSHPLLDDIEVLDGEYFSKENIFNDFVKNLESRALRFRYFNENNVLEKFPFDSSFDVAHVFEENFNKMLFISRKGDQVRLSFKGPHSELAAEWVNGFAMLANEQTAHELVQKKIAKWASYQAGLNNQMNDLRTKIAKKWRAVKQLRRAAKEKREERIAQLEEAVLIAEYAGIKEFLVPYKLSPLYLRGTKHLLAEVKVLRGSKNQVPVSIDMENEQKAPDYLQNELDDVQAKYDSLKIAKSDLLHAYVSTMRILQIATVSARPLNKPVFRWVLLTGAFSALVLGFLMAIFADFIVRAREKRALD